ncbi:MAG: Na+/H+ antiporter subunit E [Candidatus Omnitrophica bacterium]|nr:Na+/H+ antiporter subunit E [Candidatus Omnitrophota bacterium]
MIKRVILFIGAFFTWIFLSWDTDMEHIIVGIAIGIFVSFMTADLFEKRTLILVNLKRCPWFFYYIPLFIWECIKANIDGAYRVVHPDLPIRPGIVKVRTTLKSDTGLTFLANTLTLKPGTLTVDIDKENGFLYIHWIDVKTQGVEAATELIVHKFERILKKIFE